MSTLVFILPHFTGRYHNQPVIAVSPFDRFGSEISPHLSPTVACLFNTDLSTTERATRILPSQREISQLKSVQSLRPSPELRLLHGNRVTGSICRMHETHCICDSCTEKVAESTVYYRRLSCDGFSYSEFRIGELPGVTRRPCISREKLARRTTLSTSANYIRALIHYLNARAKSTGDRLS